MSFENASTQPLGRFILNYSNTNRSYKLLAAILDASRANNLVSVEDLGKTPNGVGTGKKRRARLSYYGPDCDVEGNCDDDVCGPGETTEPSQFDIDINQCTSSKVFKLDVEDVRKVDGNLDFTDHAMQQVAAKLPALRKLLAVQVGGALVTTLGVQPDGNATRRIQLVNNTNGVINPTGLFHIEKVFTDTGFMNPFIIGADEIFTYKKSKEITGLAGSGLNSGQLGDTNTYYDSLVNEVFGDGNQHVIAFDPSTIKFVSWNRNAGIFATDIDKLDKATLIVKEGVEGKWKGTIIDPAYGLAWDLEMYFSACGEYLNYKFKLHWELWTLPTPNCNIQGVNGRFHFTTCNPVLPPCPTGDPVPPAATIATYSWTPGLAASAYIGKLTVNGVTSTPNIKVNNINELAAVLNGNAGGQQFAVSGSNLTYQGFVAITGTINDGTSAGGFNITFAP